MMSYLLNSTLCLALFLAFYHFFLSNEKMYLFNRGYLLISILVAAIIPLITFTETGILSQTLATEEGLFNTVFIVSNGIEDTALFWDKYGLFVIIIYALITSILLIRFLRNIFVIKQQVKSNLKLKYKEAELVLMDKKILPYTFMQYIFLDKNAYHQNEIEEELLVHELAHVKQKHSLDLLFAELLKVFFWFNPLLFIYKKMIQLNHEFLADDAVINTSNNITDYQFLLLDKVSSSKNLALTSNLNYSLTKKRFIMMSKKSSDLIILLKKAAIIPLTICFVLLFSQKGIAQDTGISSKSMDTYVSAMKKMLKEGKGTFKVEQKVARKLNYLFSNMSEEQKKKMKKQGLILPPPPPAPRPPVVSTPRARGVSSPPPPPAPKVHVGSGIDVPKVAPPPPPPPAPLEHIKDLAKKGATFYFNGKPISSKGAIKLVKHTQGLHVSVKESNTGKVVVKLSDKLVVRKKERK